MKAEMRHSISRSFDQSCSGKVTIHAHHDSLFPYPTHSLHLRESPTPDTAPGLDWELMKRGSSGGDYSFSTGSLRNPYKLASLMAPVHWAGLA
jgi:hypothetical protein